MSRSKYRCSLMKILHFDPQKVVNNVHHTLYSSESQLLYILKDIGFQSTEVSKNEVASLVEKLLHCTHDCTKFDHSCSVHVSSIPSPHASDVTYVPGYIQPHVQIKKRGKRFIYRLISSRDYPATKCLRQDAVMMQSDSCFSCESEEQCAWFVKLRVFITVKGHQRFPDHMILQQSFQASFGQSFEPNFPHVYGISKYLNYIKPRCELVNKDDEATEPKVKRNGFLRIRVDGTA